MNRQQHSMTSGFTLLEVLISVLVLSVGLLGFAALQLTAINTNQGAYFRTQATVIAQDLASRMHVNRGYVNWDNRAVLKAGMPGDLNSYVTPAPQSAGFACAPPPAVQPRICRDQGAVLSLVCNQQQMAISDVQSVCLTASQLIPQGLVHVTCANRAPITIGVQINPRVNPYDAIHPFFQATVNPIANPLLGLDNDTCRPGSHHSIYVTWLKGQEREDAGERAIDVNARCLDIVPDGSRDCVVIDVVP